MSNWFYKNACTAAKVWKFTRANMPEAAKREAIRRVIREGNRKAVR